MTIESDKTLGRFGHHPDPVVDFCEEVDIIEGMVEDVKAGLEKRDVVEERILRAMNPVWISEEAQKAKANLRKAEVELATVVIREVLRGGPQKADALVDRIRAAGYYESVVRKALWNLINSAEVQLDGERRIYIS